MESSNITKLKRFSDAIDVDEFVDYLIEQGILPEEVYFSIWEAKNDVHKKNGLFNFLEEKTPSVVPDILQYLDNKYPNVEIAENDKKKFRQSTKRGRFPKLPPSYVKRQSLARDVKLAIESLQHEKLLIYGMMGYGKSCLVNEVLNDLTLRKHFDFNVFWVNLGDQHNVDNVISPLWSLYEMASYQYNDRLKDCPEDVDLLKSSLEGLFMNQSYLDNALIILDDVCDHNVLECFDFDANIVVTSQDQQILRKQEKAKIAVKTGFSLDETLKLFQNSLNTSEKLPQIAEEIHSISKGHPMWIAMIGSYLSDNRVDMQTNARFNKTLWEHIKITMLSGSYQLNEHDTDTKIPNEILDKCISKLLTNNQRKLFDDLAIFVQDVNIPPKVLEILWEKKPFEVINLMSTFAKKSLIVPFYDNQSQRETFVYGIHDIHLNYLKEQTKDRVSEIHRKLILNYEKFTNGDFSKLPNDNYSLQFIGYHLKNSEMYDKFSIYFDFRFLEAKIRACGKWDVINDMKKYQEYITKNDPKLTKTLEDYLEFIKHHGANIYNYHYSDIIQYGLQEAKDSDVFKHAIEMAKNPKDLYFQSQKTVDQLEYPEIINVEDDVTCARFVDSPNHILVGSSKGHIKYFYENYNKSWSSYEGHTGAITDLELSIDKRHFLSVSQDGTVMFWKFSHDSTRASLDLGDTCLASPKTKQQHWHDVFDPDKGVKKSKCTFKLNDDDDYLISASFSNTFDLQQRIVTGSYRGNVIIWNTKGEKLQQTVKRGLEAPFVMYLSGYIMFSCDDNIIRYSVKENEKDNISFEHLTPLKVKCTCPFFIIGMQIVAITNEEVWFFDGYNKNERLKPFVALQNDANDGDNICATITEDQKYLVIGTNKNIVQIYDIEQGQMLRKYNNSHHGLSRFVDTVYDDDHSVHLLLLGSDKKTLQKYYIHPVESDLFIQNSPKVTPFWKKRRRTNQPMLALFSPDNKLQILQGHLIISESDDIPSPITCTSFSVCGNNAIYGLENGEIHQYNIKTKSDTILKYLTFNEPISYLQCFGPVEEFKSLVVNGHLRSGSLSSSNDSLLDCNLNDLSNGIIVAVAGDTVKIWNNKDVIMVQISKPLIFYISTGFIIVEKCSGTYYVNHSKNSIEIIKEPISNNVVTTATICKQKNLLCICSKLSGKSSMEIFTWSHHVTKVFPTKHEILPIEAVSSCFSPDGELLVLGMKTGLIMVYTVNNNYKCTSLQLHRDRICHLMFSPTVDPILVSMADQIAWWNLKSLKFVSNARVNRKPMRLNILDNNNGSDYEVNIDLWCNKEPPHPSMPCLLACVKLRGKPKLISASNDFTSFLVMDDRGKIDVLEVISQTL